MVLGLASFIVQSHVSVFVSVQNFLKSLWKKKKKIILSFLISVAPSYELITFPPNQKRGNKTDKDIIKGNIPFAVLLWSTPNFKALHVETSWTTRGPQENRPKQRQTDEIWTKKKKLVGTVLTLNKSLLRSFQNLAQWHKKVQNFQLHSFLPALED